MVDFLKKTDIIVSIMKSISKSENNDASLSKAVRVYSSVVKAEEISDIANANILNHEMAEHLENSFKKSLNEIHALRKYYITECYKHLSKSLTEEFIAEYTDIVKLCLESSKSMKYLQDLVPKMAQVFDNTNMSCSAKKPGLKSNKAKLGLLNLALSTTYGIKFKATNNKQTHYYLVGLFDKESTSKLLPYQTDEGQFYKNSKDICFGYSKLLSDKLEIAFSSDI
ncbi:14479_t:CDS:2 [Cetraspora pellucida]|uniref:14479_t:CDS:1 n=1 Tax=Cetraspora pellucida TaxID=1433469 RepID=A0A9N9A1Z9_9GLOM|nr:14479_t:CDS:2 [Cetraspora pellucida]